MDAPDFSGTGRRRNRALVNASGVPGIRCGLGRMSHSQVAPAGCRLIRSS
jgi:hypothetical protein